MPPAAVERLAAAVQGTLPLADPLPRVVGGMLAALVVGPDGAAGPVAVPLEGLIVGTDTATGKAMLRTATEKTFATDHDWHSIMRAIERSKVAR